MKSIKDRADEYAKRICEVISYEDFNHVREDFANGARSEHEELTKWNEPEEYPDTQDQILIKICQGVYSIGYYNEPAREYRDENENRISTFDFIGWREIHE